MLRLVGGMYYFTIKANTMPPTQYVVGHPFSTLNDAEKAKIKLWANYGKGLLQNLLAQPAAP